MGKECGACEGRHDVNEECQKLETLQQFNEQHQSEIDSLTKQVEVLENALGFFTGESKRVFKTAGGGVIERVFKPADEALETLEKMRKGEVK